MGQPMQPLYTDDHGTTRFRANAIVSYLLDNGGIDMNKLAMLCFTDEDRQQFAQLIGYSLSGYGELDYVSEEAYETAAQMAESGADERDARIAALEGMLEAARKGIRTAATALFHIHPDDLSK